MQLTRLTSFLLFTSLIVCSCKKNYSDEIYTPDPVITVPDLSVKINTSVAGFIVDENNQPLGGAQVIAGSKQATTDEFGYFKISNVLLSKAAGFVTISRNGYFTNYRTFIPAVDKESFFRMKLLSKTETGIVSGSAGGTVSGIDGAKVSLPENGVVTVATGAAYTGQVHMSIRTLNFSGEQLPSAEPGDGRGIDSLGHLQLLRSFAAIAVELTADNGGRLQITAGKQAAIAIPIASSLLASAPATIALWSLDETTGLWKEEGMAIKNGSNYTANVRHFSFWEGAEPSMLVNFTAQVVSTALQPLSNVPVRITVAGQSPNSVYSAFGFTDANGIVTGPVPANTALVLDVMTPCAISAYSHNFTTTNTNVDLGTLTGNLGQSMVLISGTATNCAGQPVTNGYVQTYDGGFYNHINIVNGAFNFTGLSCTNVPVHYIVVDNSTNQQNEPQTINLVSGTNNLGAQTACGLSSVGILTYVFDGVTHVVTEPADTVVGFAFNNSSTNIVQMNIPGGGSGSPRITFEISGGFTIGSNHQTSDFWFPAFPSGRGRLAGPVTVTITEYGGTGGFIAGSFSATNVEDFNDSTSIHDISVTFRVRRAN